MACLAPQCTDQRFGQRHDILALDERCFDIDLGEFGLTIGAQIFVAEATSHLKVSIKPAAHEKLLVDLR